MALFLREKGIYGYNECSPDGVIVPRGKLTTLAFYTIFRYWVRPVLV